MPTYRLSKIAAIINGQIKGEKERTVNQLAIDTRQVYSPEGILFFALKGQHHDGHDYIGDALQKGVKNFIVQELPDKLAEDVTYIKVADTTKALQVLVKWHREAMEAQVIGVTGSNGKTIVKEWLSFLLQDHFKLIRSPKSYNSQVGVPLSLWLIEKDTELAVIEAGISQPGEMSRLETIIQPQIGILTNLGAAHQENFSSKKAKLKEKTNLFLHCKTIIFNEDDSFIREHLAESLPPGIETLSWSQENPKAIVFFEKVETKTSGTNFILRYAGQEVPMSIPFTDAASKENSFHSVTAALQMGIPPETIASRLPQLFPIAMRLEMKKGIHNCTLINDSYNSDINSLGIALNYMHQQSKHQKKTLILSDILQSGVDEKKLYQEVAKLIAANKITRLIGIGENISKYKNLFKLSKSFYSDTGQFLDRLRTSDFNNEAVLLKGARKFAFEQITRQLEERVHQTVLEINLNAFVHNLNYFRSLLKEETKIMVMVKAFSYGSGSYEIANLLQYHRVDYLGVAYADEGITLRKAGISLPIVVLNPEPSSYQAMIEHRLEPEIFNFRTLKGFTAELHKLGQFNYPVHLKLDTGMHRLGFLTEEITGLINYLTQEKSIRIASVFSHLAASDDDQHDEFTKEQIALFDKMCDRLEERLNYSFLKHILNSAGIERFPNAQYDMVRLGIGLYGISACHPESLLPVSSLKSTVAQIKAVPAGETVGYNRAGKAEGGMRIAIIPIGYADGFNRLLSNGAGEVIINGNPCPIVGNICMDLCMADITGHSIEEGDQVEIFGEKISVTDLAKKLHTIPYEILSSIPQRVKRIYYQD